MKFRDGKTFFRTRMKENLLTKEIVGMWLTAPDKHVEYAECIYSITAGKNEKALELLFPTKKIRSRGDTLNCPTLTIKLKAEFDNVLSVEITHWAGERDRKPNFEIYP